MWTKKAVLVVSLAILSILLGLALRNPLLLSMSAALLAYVSISVFANTAARLAAERKLSHEKIFEDGTAKAELLIVNRGGKTGFLEVRDKLPRQVQIKEGTNYTYLNLNPKGGATRLKYTMKFPLKGLYQIGPITLRTQDPFNLFYRESEVPEISEITVFPQVRDVKELYIKSKQPKIYPGEMKVKMPGPGTDFFAIRDYIPGDPFRDINWKAYASTGKLLVNERERLSVSDVTIVFDSREVSGIGMDSDNANLYGARAAATLANFFLKRRDSVQLVVYSDKVRTVKKGTGQKQLFEILTALASAEPKGDLPLGGIVEVVLPYMPRHSPVIVISNLEEDDTLSKAVSTMKVLEFDVTIISPNSIEFEIMAKQKKGIKVDPVAYNILRLERDILIQELMGYGVRVVDWKPAIPLTQVLLEARNY
ncbi:MAG: DUF58 domain-containing protein [Thermoplasmata archaeon]|nr:DUF58 domain-containing protein [Thermoplasmata archaeon]